MYQIDDLEPHAGAMVRRAFYEDPSIFFFQGQENLFC